MHLHNSDFYYRFLGTRLRQLLERCNSRSKIRFDPCYQLTTSSSASCQTGRFVRIAHRDNFSGASSNMPAPLTTVLIGSSGIVARSFRSDCKRLLSPFSSEPPPVRIIPE